MALLMVRLIALQMVLRTGLRMALLMVHASLLLLSMALSMVLHSDDQLVHASILLLSMALPKISWSIRCCSFRW